MDNISELIERLSNEEDAVRKMAVFKLQTNIGDPSFAEIFISQGGLLKLRNLALTASGNTLAYSLTSFSRLLELDKGWEYVNAELIGRVVELIVTHPLVNILRGAMSILVSIVSHPHSGNRLSQPPAMPTTFTLQHGYQPNLSNPGPFGFRALRPAIAAHPQFLEMLVSRLSSADHALCANSLQLINSLMRDAIMNESDNEWPRFIKRLQDLGVIKAVFVANSPFPQLQILMQSSALQDLAHPLLEFQALTKVLLRKWRDVKVDLEKKEHRIALKGLHLASAPYKSSDGKPSGSKRHHPEKWRRLGFETESPAWEFGEVGFLGMMDFTDFVRKHEDGFQKMLLEQNAKPHEQRCPVARASLAVTSILYQQFEVDKSDIDDAKTYQILESRTNFERAFRPLLLQWSRLHTASLVAFFRLWKETSATIEDFDKVYELMRVLIHKVVGLAPRTKEVQDVEDEIADFDFTRLRELQMDLLEQSYENIWGGHLRQVRDELKMEALQFVKEQRIRCLLRGEWFPVTNEFERNNGRSKTRGGNNGDDGATMYTEGGGRETRDRDHKKNNQQDSGLNWRFVKLSHNRRHLHYGDFEAELTTTPTLEELTEKIDLSTVSSVVSNVISAAPFSSSSTTTLTPLPPTTSNHNHPPPPPSRLSSTKITIHGYPIDATPQDAKEVVLLTLNPHTHSIASEWLDGLLMLLNQQPITAETEKLVGVVTGYGLKIRLLNVRYTEGENAGGGGGGGDGGGGGGRHGGYGNRGPEMPSREFVDEDYYYDLSV
ncbi:ELMO/CED-12 family-domain-containing protein [Peziza echinospora]|nr:ELMO/CED-12 family-domain-containing protein [Peziza echinospora]